MTAAMYHLRHLYQAWKPVLSSDILARCMWYLSDVVFTLFVDQVTRARDISTGACQFINSLFLKTSDETKLLMGGDPAGSQLWDKFTAIGRFMDMSLKEIQVALSDGVFRSMTGPELTRLIMATFDDSPKRQAVINILPSN